MDHRNPFAAFSCKANTYYRFRTHREICHHEKLELLAQKLNTVRTEVDDQDLNGLKIRLVILLNHLAAKVSTLEGAEKNLINERFR